jgi:hypothetical protein
MSHDARLEQRLPVPMEPELQQLLAQANREYAAPRDAASRDAASRAEAAAFRRLTLALERQRPERGLRPWRWVFAGLGAAAFAAVLVRGQWLDRGRAYDSVAASRLSAEPPVLAPAQREATGAASGEPELALEQIPPSVLARDVPERPARAPLIRQDEGSRPMRRPPAAPARPAEGSQVSADLQEDCLALARDGQPRPAERCFVLRSQGTGLSAEMALYELARLRRDVLGDALGALAALGDYRQRFPAGSLRTEVAVSRIELLARLGRGPEALASSEELLATPAGRERALELRLLRGNVYRTSGSLRDAVREYASAERLGGSLSEEATFLRAQCLEALGDMAAARQAYARAAQSAGPRRGEAQKRLDALGRPVP